MGAKETVRYWLVGCKPVPSLSQGGRHRKSTGLITTQNGTRSDLSFQGPSESGSKKKNKTSKKEWKWQRGIVAHPLSESQWNRGHFSTEQWESEKHKSWCMPAEGFKGQVATDDGSLLGTAGEWRACGWSVVQLEYDEEMGRNLHGMYGSMEAEFEIQRTIKRAELMAFFCLLKKVIGPGQGACRQQRNL